ncbi:cAMP-binding domain of CRP or a regulatory subunit of cAMP-dependent protein kinases [Amycolatopsis arida]|uniref:cAMP-binding domain of CRP or a regulatory subunit of cAMP-dependent protein kinases n=1 Tax=Amycolatopsis arida TaxID=587909 RepID=A0A1I5M4D9_9PSEU|nr:Crp/Fnr family transcriptional regulator [Amycolatopsis arida]TDX93965.1 CRP-like cAMP-binding protein [Amycolatopsis arida]SFP04432.1 cAMP-binding domain of CRP or a regulatory subunit of cAMP-dependent protein kinases [Amycolatopsis arida]
MTDLMPPAELPADEHYCLAEVDLFRDLSRREMAALGARAPQRTVAAAQVVYHPARPAEVLFIVKRGRVRLYRIGPDGRDVTTAVLGPGAVFGEMEPLGLRMRATWAETLEPGALCVMSRTDVRELLFTDPRVAVRIAEQLSTRIAELEDRLTDLTCRALGERLAATLCRLARHDPAGPIRLTHQQLAALVGASRERTTIALGELARHGLVRLRRGRILIADPARLAAIADGAAVD